jgi:hypothetical protein
MPAFFPARAGAAIARHVRTRRWVGDEIMRQRNVQEAGHRKNAEDIVK